MSIIGSLLNEVPFLILPSSWIGWIGLLVWGGGIAYFIVRWRENQKSWQMNNWLLLTILVVLVPITSLFVGIRLPAWNALPLMDVPIEPKGPALMFFSALPWVLAAGLMGVWPAVLLGGLSGLILAYWDTNTLFTPFELAFLGLLFSVAMRQRYRTWIFRALRHPLFTSLVISLLYPVIFVIDSLFITSGSLAEKIDYAITHVPGSTLSVAGAVLIAGLIAEIVKFGFPNAWGGQPPWLLAPSEKNLEARIIRNLVPLALVLIILLMAGDWIVAGNAAEQILEDRMASASKIATEAIPYFLDIGQSLILQITEDPDINIDSPSTLDAALADALISVPYFNQLFVFDDQGNPVGGYPLDDFAAQTTIPEEQAAVDLALKGVLVQSYALPPLEEDLTTQISFIAAILDEDQDAVGVLIGRTILDSNPLAQSILASLQSMESVGGSGFLLDEDHNIIYHPEPARLMLPYTNLPPSNQAFYDSTGPDGTRQLTYFQEAVGRPWSVVLTVPARQAQQLALTIAAPLLGMLFILSVIAFGLIRFSLRLVTSSLKSLTVEADRISQGELDHPLTVDGDDEVGQLRRSFEQMRVGLKRRLDELNQLLVVSQGVASSLEIENAIRPILESALSMDACSARVVLKPAVVPMDGVDDPTITRYGLGEETEGYAYLDDQLLVLMAEQNRLVLTNPDRTSLLNFKPGVPRPVGVLAVTLRHENEYYGTLWVGYDSPHTFTNEEVMFLTTLASQAALAAANSQLFLTAEFGRQRLAAILASTPDPVIVTDQQDQLLLVNPVAWQALGMSVDIQVGKAIEKVVTQSELVKLLRLSDAEDESVEVSLADGRVYLATASTIIAEGQKIGRVCVLRDVTHFKELDALKSDFVSTVSHDLRSPLTLMRGYATMLEMVGDLNDQQAGYVRKIVVGVESMSRLVNNLLDLGRIEAEIGLQLEVLSVRDIVEEVTEALRLQATQKNIQLHTDIPYPTSPLIEADRALLYQAFYNLVENAIKYTPDEKEIWVRVKTFANRMVFEVQDQGIGVSPVDIPRLFEKFYRSANREAKKERGTGLGLAIVKSIAERHKGRVWVESKLGKGSSFFLEIPLRQSQ